MYQYFFPFDCWVTFHFKIISHFSDVHSSVDGHLGCFYFLAFMSNAAMNTVCKFFVNVSVVLLDVYLQVDHNDNSTFNIWRKCQTFQSNYIILHPANNAWVTVSLHSCQHLLLSDFSIIAILVCVKYCHCGIDLHLCMCMSTHFCTSSFENVYSDPLLIFKMSCLWDFPNGPVLKILCSQYRGAPSTGRVWALVGELRSCMPHGAAKNFL